MSRRRVCGFRAFTAATVLTGALIGSLAIAGDGGLPVTDDLRALGELAREGRVPILLMVSREYCPACVRLKAEILEPMLLSGEYVDRVIMREIKIDEGERLRDFDGAVVAAAKVAKRYDTFLTPTLLFVDDHGGELAPRIRGFQDTDFYAHYIDQAIDVARDLLRRNAR